MAEHSPVDIVRHASTWSILWGVLLIVFGMLAVGSPFLAAVAVSAVIAWLIIFAGVVHLILALIACGKTGPHPRCLQSRKAMQAPE